RRLERGFGGLLVGRRLLQIFLRNRARLVQLLETRQRASGEIQHAVRGDQGRFGLEEVRAVDREQGLPLLHVITYLGEQTNDSPRIGREYLRRHLLIEVDAADRFFFDRKLAFSGRLDLDRRELSIGQIYALLGLPTAARRHRGIGRSVGNCGINRELRSIARTPGEIESHGESQHRGHDHTCEGGIFLRPHVCRYRLVRPAIVRRAAQWDGERQIAARKGFWLLL